jgi:hypothetical protein
VFAGYRYRDEGVGVFVTAAFFHLRYASNASVAFYVNT